MGLVDILLRAPWPSTAFVLASCVALPVYVILVVALLNGRRQHQRFRTTYYNLILSQALTDVVAMPAYMLAFIFRSMLLFTDFYWTNRQFLAPFAFNSNHYFLMVRCFGDFLVSLQRYLILCHSASAVQRVVAKLSFFTVLLLHWIPPLVVSLPITLNLNKTFDTPDTVRTVVDSDHQKMADCVEVVYQLILFSASVVVYSFVLKLIIRNRSARGLTREMRLSLVVMGQSVAFGMSLAFYITQFIVVHLVLTNAVYQIRNYFPLLTGFESYINPFLHCLLNSDLRKEVLKIIKTGTNAFGTSSSESQSERGQNSSIRGGTDGTGARIMVRQ